MIEAFCFCREGGDILDGDLCWSVPDLETAHAVEQTLNGRPYVQFDRTLHFDFIPGRGHAPMVTDPSEVTRQLEAVGY
jgi:hypothetical protein